MSPTFETLRTETEAGVGSIVLSRADEYNTITPRLRDELIAAVEAADADPAVPTIAAVQGWCIAGGTDMVLCADIVIAGQGASFGYPPSRVWGTPTTAMWVYRMGLERAKRYLLTGDEIPAEEAARIGLILECVADERLLEHATALARRMALLPESQLVMLKLLCNQTVENMGIASTRLLGTLFDGIARHTQEGRRFVDRAAEVGFRQAVRERDDPFGDYGSRPRRPG
jgi:enoyl-CoA hydratase